MIWQPEPVYVVWRLSNGQWAAQGQKNWPLPAIERAEGKTAAHAITAWRRTYAAAAASARGQLYADYSDKLRRTHFVVHNGVARTLCGQPAERRRRTDAPREANCATCIKVANGPGVVYSAARRRAATRALKSYATAWKKAHA